MVKESVEQEDITSVNICTPNIEAPKYIKHIWTNIKGEIDSNTIIVGDFNTPFTLMVDYQNGKWGNTSLKWYIRWDGSYWYL